MANPTPIAMPATPEARGQRRTLVGVVTRDKMDKTRRVEIPRLVKHVRYGKYIKRRTICTPTISWKPARFPRTRIGGWCGL